MGAIDITRIDNNKDERGDSFYIPRKFIDFIGTVDEVHYATIAPGEVRGNHYHRGRREFIFISFRDEWKLAFRLPGEEKVQKQEFRGSGGVIIAVQAKVIHAIKNSGSTAIQIVSFSNKRFDPENPDTLREVILD